MKVYWQRVPCKRNFMLILMQFCTSFLHGLKKCIWFGFNPAVIFCHFSTLLTMSFFNFRRCDISFTEVRSIFSWRGSFCSLFCLSLTSFRFLTHLSRRLIGWVGLRRPSSICRLLLRNRLDNQSNFIWSLHGMGERKFVQTVQVTWPRWPPCQYIIKTLKKVFFSGTKRPMTLKVSMQHWVREYYQVCSNVDHVLTLTIYGKVKFGPLCFCMGKR